MEPTVKEKFSKYPNHIRPKMEELRSLIYEVAESTESIGKLEETLKWGEPAYLTTQTKSGTTIRIDWKSKHPDQLELYVSCNTSLVDTWRTMFGKDLNFEGNRALILPVDKPFPKKRLMICIQMALKYHVDKRT